MQLEFLSFLGIETLRLPNELNRHSGTVASNASPRPTTSIVAMLWECWYVLCSGRDLASGLFGIYPLMRGIIRDVLDSLVESEGSSSLQACLFSSYVGT